MIGEYQARIYNKEELLDIKINDINLFKYKNKN